MQRSSTLVAAACFAALSGCAIRYDGTGVSRVGVGLWGFGDPPGVNWNLDWPPRRDVPELPPMGPRDVPELRRSPRVPVDDAAGAMKRDNSAGRDVVIDDNRCRAVYSNELAQFAPLSPRADLHGSPAPRS